MAKCVDFQFDPDKSALENFFNLIYRNNRIKFHPEEVDVGEPRVTNDDPDGDNTIVLIKMNERSMYEGEDDLYYARADINEHYPDFQIDLEALKDVNDKEALTAYIDGNFNLVDGEFDLDVEDPLGDLFARTSIDIIAKDKSLIYIGKKTINIFWSGGLRRITEEGRVRCTEEGVIRIVD